MICPVNTTALRQDMVRADGDIEPLLEAEVVIDSDYDGAKVDKLFRNFYQDRDSKQEEPRLYYYTEPHIGSLSSMGVFGDFSSSVVYAVNHYHGRHLPLREKYTFEFTYSKLCHLVCTLDKSVCFGFFNRHMAQSKVVNLNAAATILGHPELSLDAAPLKEKNVSEKLIVEFLFQVKKNAIKLLKEIKTDIQGSMIKSAIKHNLSFPSVLAEKFGSNLVAIILYGSSAKGEGADFDIIVVLKKLPDNLYKTIWNLKPTENGKEVGMIFIPEYVLEKFLYINVSNTIFRDHARVLKGQISFPIESARYTIYKEMYHAGFGSSKLISGMNLIYRIPEIFFDKPGLYEYFMKLNRFSLQGFLQRGGYKIVDKSKIFSMLKEDFGFEISDFRADAKYLQEKFNLANEASVRIARKMYDPALARENNEKLVLLGRQVSNKAFQATVNGRTLYVFMGREKIVEKDVVPVKILSSSEEGCTRLKRYITYKKIDSSRDFLVGRRV